MQQIKQEVESAIASQTMNFLELNIDGVAYEIFIPKMQAMMTKQAKERFILKETAKIMKTIYEHND